MASQDDDLSVGLELSRKQAEEEKKRRRLRSSNNTNNNNNNNNNNNSKDEGGLESKLHTIEFNSETFGKYLCKVLV